MKNITKFKSLADGNSQTIVAKFSLVIYVNVYRDDLLQVTQSNIVDHSD